MEQRQLQQIAAGFSEPRLDIDDGNQATADLHAREDLLLEHYSLIDGQPGTIRIPIERAMQLIVQRGLPVANQTTTAADSVAHAARPEIQGRRKASAAEEKPAQAIDMNAQLRSQLSPNEVLKLAEQYISKKGINPKEYENRSVSLKIRKGRLEWLIFFNPSERQGLIAVGDHFTVYVDDANKEIEFMGGL